MISWIWIPITALASAGITLIMVGYSIRISARRRYGELRQFASSNRKPKYPEFCGQHTCADWWYVDRSANCRVCNCPHVTGGDTK